MKKIKKALTIFLGVILVFIFGQSNAFAQSVRFYPMYGANQSPISTFWNKALSVILSPIFIIIAVIAIVIGIIIIVKRKRKNAKKHL